ncbi:MAG TPA: HD domain-containing phosphohydrolase [Solirubrobacteraceae bacterium]|jgi:PAS domain S-box-containing protein|nr:HD domain-containing phosphohydrolase [Solirubrobacteraceae bacterium]
MLSHPHLPQLRELRAGPSTKRATVVVAMIGFALIFAVRLLDSDAANAEGALFVVPVGVLALRFGLRGGAWGALLALVLTAAWGLLDGVHLTTLGYATRALTIVALAMLLGNFVDRRRKLEAEVSRYYDASLDLLATADMNGHFTRVNPAWQRLLGYTPEELCARPFIDFVHADDREATIAETVGLAQSLDTIGFRNRYRASDGSYRWLEWSASASEGVIHAVARDVTVQHQAEDQLADSARSLEKLVEERTRELDDARAETLRQLAIAAEYRDDETYQHTERVGHVASRLALGLRLPAGQVTLLRRAAPLHDVGKLAIPDCILLKPGKLSDEEFEVMKTHAELGARLLSSGSSRVLQTAAVIAATHHERWDGKGYPKGMHGDAIPLVGRIVAVADVFDALTHDRPYKEAWTVESACAEIERSAGSQFDPRVVKAFLAMRADLDTICDDIDNVQPNLDLAILTERPMATLPRRRGEGLEHVDLHAPRAQPSQRRVGERPVRSL